MAVVTTGGMMVIDTSKCIGCRACQIACQQWHQLPAEDTSFTGSYQNPPFLSAASLNVVTFNEALDVNGCPKWLFFPNRCRHCESPPCMEYCPGNRRGIQCIVRSPLGIVVFTNKCRPDLCSQSDVKPCQRACPYKDDLDPSSAGVPRYKKNDGTLLPGGKANKCDLCYDRYRSSKLATGVFDGAFGKSNKAACELACPTGAVRSGPSRTMAAQARERVLALQANGYPQATYYPRGLPSHMVWILTEPAEAYGLGRIS